MKSKMKVCEHTCAKCKRKGKVVQVPGTVAMPRGWRTGSITLNDFTNESMIIDIGELCTTCVREIVSTFKGFRAHCSED